MGLRACFPFATNLPREAANSVSSWLNSAQLQSLQPRSSSLESKLILRESHSFVGVDLSGEGDETHHWSTNLLQRATRVVLGGFMFWVIVRFLCAGSFVVDGFKSFGCTSVSISGGRILQTTCYDDHSGSMPGSAGGMLQLVIGLVILMIPVLLSNSRRSNDQVVREGRLKLALTPPLISAGDLVGRLKKKVCRFISLSYTRRKLTLTMR